MKNTAYASLFILVLGSLAHFGLPWWSVAVIAGIAGVIFPISAGKGFSFGFASGWVLWYMSAQVLNLSNGGQLAGKVGILFQGLQGWQLLAITGLLGGLLAGLGMLTGCYLRPFIRKEEKMSA